jgi:hypothetical protein
MRTIPRIVRNHFSLALALGESGVSCLEIRKQHIYIALTNRKPSLGALQNIRRNTQASRNAQPV